jgi:hypothetical protein
LIKFRSFNFVAGFMEMKLAKPESGRIMMEEYFEKSEVLSELIIGSKGRERAATLKVSEA